MDPSRTAAGPASIDDAMVERRHASTNRRTAMFADQVAADADQLAADADQALSDADQALETAAQTASETDQHASDQDQASADRERASSRGLSPHAERAYQAARSARAAAAHDRVINRQARSDAANDRDATSTQRDRIADERDERGRARDRRATNRLPVSSAREAMARPEAETSQESGARYRGLLEAAPDAMVVVNQAGQIVLLNVQAEKRFGYHRDELLGQPVTNIIPEGFAERLVADDLRSAEDALAQVIGTGIELTALRKDGSDFPIEIMLSPLGSTDGVLVIAAIRDITVRKAAEARLAESEQRFRTVLEASPNAVVAVDAAGMILFVNPQTEVIFGYERAELIGRPIELLLPQRDGPRHIGLREGFIAHPVARPMGIGLDLTGRRKDGAEFPAEISLAHVETAHGPQVFASVADITARKDAESNLAQMEGRYRGLLEAAPDAMVVVDQRGVIVLVNVQTESQFGYSRDELLGQPVTNIIPDGFAERLIADAQRSAEDALAQVIGTGIELIALRRDGSEFPIEIMLSPLDSTDGVLVTAAIRDISVRTAADLELQQKIEDLNRSNEELGQFAYIASHDLQEPLRMVASYTQLLSRRYTGKLDADADEFIAFAVDGASRMQRLIQDLLTFSRVGSRELDLEPTRSDDALEQALTNLRGSIEECGAKVSHGSLPSVMADESQLIQLFQNLVGNAIKYQSPGIPTVHVSAARVGSKRWMFSVKDNGLGIDPQYFDRIFGMFQRLHKREEFEGTGIGLAICKKIVERHGGVITVESAPGLGSTFRFALAGTERRA